MALGAVVAGEGPAGTHLLRRPTPTCLVTIVGENSPPVDVYNFVRKHNASPVFCMCQVRICSAAGAPHHPITLQRKASVVNLSVQLFYVTMLNRALGVRGHKALQLIWTCCKCAIIRETQNLPLLLKRTADWLFFLRHSLPSPNQPSPSLSMILVRRKLHPATNQTKFISKCFST